MWRSFLPFVPRLRMYDHDIFLLRLTEQPKLCGTDEDVVDGDLKRRKERKRLERRRPCSGPGKSTHVDELDEVADSAHHGESDCDGAADLEVLCNDINRVGGGRSARTKPSAQPKKEEDSPFLSGFVHREMNCARAQSKGEVSMWMKRR